MNQFQLRKAVDEILWNEWDPKGLKNSEGAYDTYYPFISGIVELLIAKKEIPEIAELLHHYAYDDLVVRSEIEDHLAVAKQLRALV